MQFLNNLSQKHKVLLAIIIAIVIGIPVLGLLNSRALISSTQTSVARPMAGVGGGRNGNAMIQKIAYDEGADMMADETMMAEPAIGIMPPVPEEGGFTPGVERTIVKNANISMVVDDTRQTISQINTITQQVGGTVTDSSVNEAQIESGIVYANMTLRVPVDSLENALSSIRELGVRVTSENISSQDKTEQKIDIEAQLNNLYATETQFQTIMEDATTVEETLQVQRELSNVRSQIERLEARLENLEGDAAMSTIYVSLSTEESELPIVDGGDRSIIQEIKLAFRDALIIYRELFIAGLRFVIIGAPLLIVVAIGFLIWKKRK